MRRTQRICGRHSLEARLEPSSERYGWAAARPNHRLSNLHKHMYPQTVSAICINPCIGGVAIKT